MKEKSEQKVNELVDRSMQNLSELVDVDHVVGAPIVTASGFQVIPVSRVTVGYRAGGGDLVEIKVIKDGESVPFAGGSGVVVSLKPAGFIVDEGKGCRYIRAGEDPLDNLIDKASEWVGTLSGRND